MKILYLSLICLLAISCKSNKNLNDASDTTVVNEQDSTIEENNVIDGKPQRPYQVTATIGDVNQKTDVYDILKVKIEGNTLFIDISYTGGCAWHKFEFVGSADILKSLPPQRHVKLLHDNDDDSCESLVKQTIEVDLTALAASQTPGSEIVLILEGYSEHIKYIYE